MRKMFNNVNVQSEFDQNGYVILPLLNANEVSVLLNYYLNQDFDNKIEAGFHISLDNQNEELVKEVGLKIKSILGPKTSEFLDDCKIFTASYVIKEPGLQNIVPPHQDWTFVDETEFSSATVWTALTDVDEQNGALGVIRGSHRIFNHKRSSPSPQSKSPLSDHVFTLFPFIDVVEMKAGDCLIFDNRLIHASPPNLSNQTRIAVGVGITQKEAQLKHFFQNSQSGKLEEYNVDESFFTWFNNKRLSDLFDNNKSPEGLSKVGEIDRIVPNLTKLEMEELVQQLDGVVYNRPFMDRLAKLFDYSTEGPTQQKEVEEQVQTEFWKDDRSFLQKYSIGNIVREIAWRLKGRPTNV